MDAREQTKTQTPDILIVALLAVAAIAAVGLLLPEPIDSGSVRTWLRVPIPLFLAGGMGQLAFQAHRRGEDSTARAVLGWAIAAVALLGIVGNH
jgi:peptidoglycan/LPS O-acetylase OafA/YrhL